MSTRVPPDDFVSEHYEHVVSSIDANEITEAVSCDVLAPLSLLSNVSIMALYGYVGVEAEISRSFRVTST